MVTLSPKATKAILDALNEGDAGPDQGFRVEEQNGELSLKIDSVRDNDRVVNYFGATLLIVDEDLEQNIGDAVVDVDDGPEGERIIIRSNGN